jgi:hypothetical protein
MGAVAMQFAYHPWGWLALPPTPKEGVHMSDSTYLELVEGVGVEADFTRHHKTGLDIPNPKAGEPAPLCEIGIQIPVAVRIGNDVGTTTRSVQIKPLDSIDPDDPVASRIIPGTRIVETHAPAVVNVLVETGHYRQCDPPKTEQPRKPATTKGE